MKPTSWLLTGTMVLLPTAWAAADDAAVRVAGGTASILEEHSSIRMIGEDVRIDLRDKDYLVEAKFTFYNDAASTHVTMGFPQTSLGDVLHVEDFIDFETSVNGMKVNATDYPNELEPEARMERKWKVKEVFFPSKQITTTAVRYTAPYGHYSTGPLFVRYELGTGSSWNSSIGRSTFSLSFPDSCRLNLRPRDSPFSSIEAERVIRKRNELTWVVPDFEPGPLEALTIAFGGRTQPWDDLLQPNHFEWAETRIDTDTLKMWSASQLRVLRNEIYARHGRIFNDQGLRDYFESRTWYKPRPGFRPEELSEVERENVTVIANFERQALTQ
ncbi:MAG: YARHG domain-containing protein [Elusimicrobiota bacterium]